MTEASRETTTVTGPLMVSCGYGADIVEITLYPVDGATTTRDGAKLEVPSICKVGDNFGSTIWFMHAGCVYWCHKLHDDEHFEVIARIENEGQGVGSQDDPHAPGLKIILGGWSDKHSVPTVQAHSSRTGTGYGLSVTLSV